MRTYALNEDHSLRVISPEEFVLLETFDRKVGRDVVGEHIISTVFLGFDHSYGDGPPLLFETMIFNEIGCQAYESYQPRFSTWDEAIEGHAAAVAMVKQHMGL